MKPFTAYVTLNIREFWIRGLIAKANLLPFYRSRIELFSSCIIVCSCEEQFVLRTFYVL
jgi:hypothetical protein